MDDETIPGTDGQGSLASARELALEVRALYETLEDRINGRTWSLHELMIGFSQDVGQIGRLILAEDGTWPVDGDVDAQLRHKLAESMWWTFVIADRLGIDMDAAYTETMTSIEASLRTSVDRTSPRAGER